jgi:glyoxylase-like metal-dependent hydrolase (beta-lactamase superfamily II)
LAERPEPAPGHPEIARIVAPNPGPMTLEGTNTYVVAGEGGAYVIDPGPDDAGHLGRVREAADAAGGIVGVLLTHGHSDHSDGVEALGAPLLWGRASGESEMETLRRALEAGSIEASDGSLADVGSNPSLEQRVGPFALIATPGHAADHVSFVLGDVCFCGDLVLGTGSTIVPPAAGGGSLTAYLSSLAALEALDSALLAPGHGPWITDPAARIAEYTEHRLDRERRLVAALEAGERSRAALLAQVWDDVPEQLRPAAAIAMQAHVEKLEAEDRLDPTELID